MSSSEIFFQFIPLITVSLIFSSIMTWAALKVWEEAKFFGLFYLRFLVTNLFFHMGRAVDIDHRHFSPVKGHRRKIYSLQLISLCLRPAPPVCGRGQGEG